MNFEDEPIPSISGDEAARRVLTYKAFLSHERSERRGVVNLLHSTLREYGISDDKFYDPYTKKENINGSPVDRLMNGLLSSEFMIVFLTPDFLKRKWTMWELRTFLAVMEKDARRKFLPVFYKVSGKESQVIVKRAHTSSALREYSGELTRVLEKVNMYFGIDAEGLRMSDIEVVSSVMKKVFEIDMRNERTVNGHENHNVATCINPLCDYKKCVDRTMSYFHHLFAVPPLPIHTRLNFDDSELPEKILRDTLLSKEPPTAVAAIGVRSMGGLGKTTCLIGVASNPQVRDIFPEGVFWIQLSIRTKAEEMRKIFVNIIKYARSRWNTRGVDFALNPLTSLEDVVKSARKALQDKRCLFVLDGFCRFHGYESTIAQFIQIVSPPSTILLSTRSNKVVELFAAEPIVVDYLDDETASDLFDDWREAKPRNEEEERHKKEILRLCCKVPLFVCTAGLNVSRIDQSTGKEQGLTKVLEDLKGNLRDLKKPDHIDIDIWNKSALPDLKLIRNCHNVATCSVSLCDYPMCAYRIWSSRPEVEASELSYRAFLSHEGTEKRTVVDLFRRELHRQGINTSRVFYDDYMKRGGGTDEILRDRLMEGLLGSKYLIVFLTPKYLKKKWPMLELSTFLGMMEKDKRRKLLPVFYRISAKECGDIVKQRMGVELKEKLGSRGYDIEELRHVLRKVKRQIGIDAEGRRKSDTEVVTRIMKDVFLEPRNVTVFLSHAREDRGRFTGLLRREIEARNSRIRCYLDEKDLARLDDAMPEEVQDAISKAEIGVFVLSPEFVAQKRTMQELRRFLGRCEETWSTNDIKPSLYPIFYRLTKEECKDAGLYSRDAHIPTFIKHGFFSEKRRRSLPPDKSMSLLQQISQYPGSSYDDMTHIHEFAADVANEISELVKH